MDFSLSEERKMLQETVARFFENNYNDIKKRSEYLDMNDGFSREFWKECSNLGVISGLISPSFGGLGGSGEDISIIFELIGKSLCIEPFLSSGLLSSTILSSIKNPKTGSGLASAVLAETVRQSGQVGDAISVAEGQIVNPYSYQVFGGMAHRTFNYQFDLVPRNSREAEEIKRICDMFLFYMLPSKGGGSANLKDVASEHFLKMPSQWDIKYYRNGNQLTHHQQPFKCFLSSCDIQYGSDAENFLHEDGSPVKTSISLSYIEIEPLIQNKVMSE